MPIQRIGSRPNALVHQAAAGFFLDGTQPSSNLPVFDANANLVFPEETLANGSGLFEFGHDRTSEVQRVTIEVPSADVAGWSLFVSGPAGDVLIETTAVMAASYTATAVPFPLMRGESVKLIMVGASAGLIRGSVVANTVDS